MTNDSAHTQRNASQGSTNSSTITPISSSVAAIKYAHQAEKLSFLPQDAEGTNIGAAAVRAEWVTPHDPIIITAGGGRLPGVPLAEAHKLNHLREEIDGVPEEAIEEFGAGHFDKDELDNVDASTLNDKQNGSATARHGGSSVQKSGEGSLRRAMPPSRTNPLFPPLPLYGPPSRLRDLQCMTFRASSAVLSLAFLSVIVLGSAFTSIPMMFNHIWLRLTFRDPDARRPFHKEEKRRAKRRKEMETRWEKRKSLQNSNTRVDDNEDEAGVNGGFVPTEGGPDPLICDAGYYARRVGLDVEEVKVQTEDGFIINLWHVFDPSETTPMTAAQRQYHGPDISNSGEPSRQSSPLKRKAKYPVLMMHGLLQSAGAYCTNDDESLAFFLCKSGYDVWLGNNRCGFKPEHSLLEYSDPRMWAWNIRQMGVMDLPALVSRVLAETGFEKLGLICHSQGTTQTFVALAKEQRPDLGDKISVFCALAPAAYAGPLIGKMYFKFMRVISPALFRLVFGIHAFIPFMMTMHSILPGNLYGAMGYRVFSFLFNWSDDRWERALRDRMFLFAPVYVSAESMRWWLGRECFAKQKCILQTREEGRQEDVEDEMEQYYSQTTSDNTTHSPRISSEGNRSGELTEKHRRKTKGSTAWYNEQVPPFALWVCGSDDLVDGRKLLRRFARGREPHVRIVHQKVIEEYEHLDVIWAMDSIEKVGKEVRTVLWQTCAARDRCRVPVGCEDVEEWIDTKLDTPSEKPYAGGDDGGDDNDEEEEQSSSSDEQEDLIAPGLKSSNSSVTGARGRH